MASTTMGIKLDRETQKRLKQLGELKDRSPHWIMKTAIQEYLQREEVVEQERREDEERWQRFVQTGAFVDHAEMMAWMDELAGKARRRAGKR